MYQTHEMMAARLGKDQALNQQSAEIANRRSEHLASHAKFAWLRLGIRLETQQRLEQRAKERERELAGHE